jgi:hypothetical protein
LKFYLTLLAPLVFVSDDELRAVSGKPLFDIMGADGWRLSFLQIFFQPP